MKDCFEGLIGLSQSECDCYDGEIIDGRKSSLGLYVDEHEGIDLELIQSSIGCGDTLLKVFDRLYDNAVNFFESDLQVAISQNFKQRYSPYIGRIAEKTFTKPLDQHVLSGLMLETKNIDSASIVVKSLSLYFDSIGDIHLSIYKNSELIEGPITISVIDGSTVHTFPTPLNLPISQNGLKNDYYFMFTSDGPVPMNNKSSCNCQGIEASRGKFLKAKGVYGTNFNNLKVDNTYAYGISMDATISCSIDSLLCNFMVDSLFNRRSGIALWYKMGALLIEEVFASRNINYDTMSDREYLYGRKNKFNKEYRELVLWLAENSIINNSNCFVCDTRKTLRMGKNLI